MIGCEYIVSKFVFIKTANNDIQIVLFNNNRRAYLTSIRSVAFINYCRTIERGEGKLDQGASFKRANSSLNLMHRAKKIS